MSRPIIQMKDVPQELLQAIRQQFEADPRVRNLRVQQNLAQRKCNLQLALSIGKNIEKLYSLAVQAYIEETEKEYSEIDLKAADLPQNVAEELMEIVITLFLAADIIDTAAMDFNDILHRVDKNLDMTHFDDLSKLAKEAKGKLEYFSKHSNYMKDIAFGEKSDNMYKLLRNKARALRNKHKGKDDGKGE